MKLFLIIFILLKICENKSSILINNLYKVPSVRFGPNIGIGSLFT